MSTTNNISKLFSALQCIGKEWTTIGGQILCDNTPIFDLPDDSEDPAMKLRNDLMRELTRVVNDYSLTERLALSKSGPWVLTDDYLLLGNIGLAGVCDPKSDRIPFQKSCAKLFLDIANTITPKQLNFEYAIEPHVVDDGFSYEESTSRKRIVVVTRDLEIVRVDSAAKGDTVYEAVQCNNYDFIIIRTYIFNPEKLDNEPRYLTSEEYRDLAITLPDVVQALRFEEYTNLPVFVSDKRHTFTLIH